MKNLGYTLTKDCRTFLVNYDIKSECDGFYINLDFENNLSKILLTKKLKKAVEIKNDFRKIWPNEKLWVIKVYKDKDRFYVKSISNDTPSWLRAISTDLLIKII